MATQNPIESEGTYPLPEAQVDRFMLKVLVDYPAVEDEHTIAQRALIDAVDVNCVIELPQLRWLQEATKSVYVDPAVTRYAVRLASVTRDLAGHGLEEIDPFVSFGVSPRGPISMLHAARALAVLRGRRYVLPSDVHELAPDAMRHRLVLSYRALAEGVSSEAIIAPVLERVPMPRVELVNEVA
jgi:MoxR-like ATPase